MKRYGFIYNPQSRGGKMTENYRRLQQASQELNARLVRVNNDDNIDDIARELSDKTEVVVACGGDGTVQKVVSGLLFTGKTLGIIPLGSGNDLVKSLGIPSNIDKALKLLTAGNIKSLDVGQCNDSVFVNSLGFGFDGLTNTFAAKMAGLPGNIRYVIAALKANLRHIPFQVKITRQGKSEKRRLIMVAFTNGRVEGGTFWIAPKASVRDGFLELITIKPVNKFLLPFFLSFFVVKRPKLLKAYSKEYVDSCLIEFDHPVPLHIDGEISNTTATSFHITVIPEAIDVICGE